MNANADAQVTQVAVLRVVGPAARPVFANGARIARERAVTADDAADLRGRLTDTLETIVHTAGATVEGHAPDGAANPGTANALLLAERCFMAGRLQRFIHVNGVREDRMVRAAMNAGLPVTIIGPGINTMDLVVSAVVRAVSSDVRCA